MQFIPVVLRSIFIISVLSGIIYRVAGFEKPDPADQTIMSINDCMARTPTTWPDEWKKEYIDTIRKEIFLYQNDSQYNLKLEILQKGFASYWESFTKSAERSLFEVHQAQIRWYVEYLMGSEFPTDQERQKLHNQYTDIWNYATDSLLKQFPFLDPNVVQEAKADDLSECYRKIETPLMPVYLRPMSEKQVAQIKQRWDKLRYARVDLWSRLGDSSKTRVENRDAPSSNTERDYELTQKSLSQLLGQIWMIVFERPDYYISALKNRSMTIQDRLKSKRQARNNERRLEKGRSRQLLQTEHIGFLLSALLETPRHFGKLASASTQEQILSEQQGKTAKGGGAL